MIAAILLMPHPNSQREPLARLAASYANFYLCIGAVIVPLLDRRTDGAAVAKLKRIFPEREVVAVAGREILLGGDNIHCITQQVPAARKRRKAGGEA
jgi:agmatine deiminase